MTEAEMLRFKVAALGRWRKHQMPLIESPHELWRMLSPSP
jgi:hypothetical protein